MGLGGEVKKSQECLWLPFGEGTKGAHRETEDRGPALVVCLT